MNGFEGCGFSPAHELLALGVGRQSQRQSPEPPAPLFPSCGQSLEP